MATKSRFLSAEFNLSDTLNTGEVKTTKTNNTVTISTFTKDHKTGISTTQTMEITGQTFSHSFGSFTRDFIIHKDINKTKKNYVLTDVRTGNRVSYLEATTKKAATVELAKHVLQALADKHGTDRLTQVFQNADLSAGLEPQI